ncbi:aminoglycoside phosphotransferase family protein [Calothrix sp. NIES-3974]|uniref:aminoglycoside phosphotransferase family protein n=1 Tax=Calothrix sp. NIES-3974 TaxID=2005462 RepID=UPI000B601A43|nr:aminoglycoside phosphotransferase family protein [Calothrix sp. NIES-3974]BAZ03561.1 hypothetical protein NIES3974_01900 [Calothrix sp. NIES-3974]
MIKFTLSSQNLDEYLIEKNICTPSELTNIDIQQKKAKNFNLLVSFNTGRKLLVKQEPINREGKTLGEFHREWLIHNFCQKFSETAEIRNWISEALYFDQENSIIIFNYLQNYRDVSTFYLDENKFPTEIAASIGWALAAIHRRTFTNQTYQNFFAENSIEGVKNFNTDLCRDLERITPEVFGSIPDEGIRFFSLYQKFDSLGKAIAELREAFLPCCLAHNDLKLNNILLADNWQEITPENESIVRIIDWERSSWGDPAFDLGTIVANYLQIWLFSLVVSSSMAIEESLKLATIPLEQLQPSIAALAVAYFSNFPEIVECRPHFLNRVIQFTGLNLIQSIQAMIQHQKTFGNPGICMLQVAKSLICRPEESVSTVFSSAAVELAEKSYSRV